MVSVIFIHCTTPTLNIYSPFVLQKWGVTRYVVLSGVPRGEKCFQKFFYLSASRHTYYSSQKASYFTFCAEYRPTLHWNYSRQRVAIIFVWYSNNGRNQLCKRNFFKPWRDTRKYMKDHLVELRRKISCVGNCDNQSYLHTLESKKQLYLQKGEEY